MKILSIRSKYEDQLKQKLKAAGRVFLWDTIEDWGQWEEHKYDAVVIGPGEGIEESVTNALRVTVGVVLIEDCPKSLIPKFKEKWTVVSNGRSVGILLHFGSKQTDSSLHSSFPCGYRGTEPVRTVGCKPCQTLTGKSSVEIFHCSLFDCECSLASREMQGKGKLKNRKTGPQIPGERYSTVAACTTCKERKE